MTNTSSTPSIRSTPITHAPVTVLGLGSMGTAISRALLAAGAPITVWNRTSSRAEALAETDATIAPDPASAVAASELIITILRDHHSTMDLLGALPDGALAGRTVVVLASSTPAEARRTQAWAEEQGITLLIGAIMVPTPMIGTDQSLVLYAGDESLLTSHREVLETFAASSAFVGEDPGLAALLDTAMLEVFFSGMTAFLHAVGMVTANGLTAADFLPWARSMTDILPTTFEGIAAGVDAGTHPGIEDTIAMEQATLAHMIETGRESGLDSRLPELMHDLAQRAVDAGHGGDSWSRIIDVLRSR